MCNSRNTRVRPRFEDNCFIMWRTANGMKMRNAATGHTATVSTDAMVSEGARYDACLRGLYAQVMASECNDAVEDGFLEDLEAAVEAAMESGMEGGRCRQLMQQSCK